MALITSTTKDWFTSWQQESGGSAGLQPGEMSTFLDGASAPVRVVLAGAKAHEFLRHIVAGLKPGASAVRQ